MLATELISAPQMRSLAEAAANWRGDGGPVLLLYASAKRRQVGADLAVAEVFLSPSRLGRKRLVPTVQIRMLGRVIACLHRGGRLPPGPPLDLP